MGGNTDRYPIEKLVLNIEGSSDTIKNEMKINEIFKLVNNNKSENQEVSENVKSHEQDIDKNVKYQKTETPVETNINPIIKQEIKQNRILEQSVEHPIVKQESKNDKIEKQPKKDTSNKIILFIKQNLKYIFIAVIATGLQFILYNIPQVNKFFTDNFSNNTIIPKLIISFVLLFWVQKESYRIIN